MISANPTASAPPPDGQSGCDSIERSWIPATTITYGWDLNNDGVYTDATTATTSVRNFTTGGLKTIRLMVTDNLRRVINVASVVINVATPRPTMTIDTPLTSQIWKVGDATRASADMRPIRRMAIYRPARDHVAVHPASRRLPLKPASRPSPGVSGGTFTVPNETLPGLS